MNLLRRLWPLLFLVTAALLRGAAVLPQISAQHTGGTLDEPVFTGAARLTYEDVLLLADEIRYNVKTQVAVAKGHVSLTRNAQRLLADEITYRLLTRSYEVQGLRLGDAPLYVSGSGLVGDGKKVTIRDAQLYYTEPGPWSPTLKADSLTYVPGQTVRAERAYLGLGGFSFMRLPVYNQSVNAPLLEDLSLKAGYRSSLGAFADASLLVPVAPNLKLGGDVGFYTARGVLFGPSASAKIERPDFTLVDRLRTGYIQDSGNRGVDRLGRPVPMDRGFIDWSHHEQIGDHFTLIGKLNYWSDSEIIRDFRPEQFFPVQTPDSFLEADYAGDNSILSAFVRAQPNSFAVMQERLPEVRFDQFATPVALGVYESFSASAVVLREDPPVPSAAPTVRTTRLDAVYELTRPFTPREWLSVKPVAGARVTYYDQATGGRSTYTRALGEVGVDAELHSSATYDYTNARWGINGLRHLVTPTFSYRYIPEATKGQPYIPAIDRDVFSNYLQPLGFGGTRNIDQLSATNTLRIGLNQTLQTRDLRYGSRDLVTLNLAADWRFDTTTGERRFSAIQAELAVMPASWVRVDAYTRVDPQTGGLREFNTGVTLHDADAWSVRFASSYLEHQLQEYVIDGTYRLNEVNEALARVRYDARLNRLIEQSYGLRQTLGNLWLVRYMFVLYDGPRRESSFGFNIEVELKRF